MTPSAIKKTDDPGADCGLEGKLALAADLFQGDVTVRAIMEALVEGVVVIDGNGIILRCNTSAEKMFGYNCGELIGQQHLLLFPERFRKRHPLDGIMKQFPGLTGLRRDGGEFPLEFAMGSIQTRHGELILALITDITRRKEAEEGERSWADRYRTLFENSMDGIFLAAPDGTIHAANAAACAMFGMTEDELIRLGRAGLIDQSDPCVAAALKEREVAGTFLGEITFKRKDGTRFPGEISSVIVDHGSRAFVMIRDITRRKQAEESLKGYAQRLLVVEEDLRKEIAREIHDDVGQMISALGFELADVDRNIPGSAVQEVRPRLKNAQALIKEISKSVRNLMAKLHPQALELLGLPQAIQWYVEQWEGRTGVEVVFDVDDEFPRFSSEKEMALFRICQEALLNIAKHAEAKKVLVSLHRDGNAVRLRIHDDGKGFDQQGKAPQLSGTGWGLTIMRERASLAGGTFTLDTEAGEGTTVGVEVCDP